VGHSFTAFLGNAGTQAKTSLSAFSKSIQTLLPTKVLKEKIKMKADHYT